MPPASRNRAVTVTVAEDLSTSTLAGVALNETNSGAVTSGGPVSTVKLRLAEVGSRLPAGSVARTSNVWAPSLSALIVVGELQAAKLSVSTRHSKLDADSLDENT